MATNSGIEYDIKVNSALRDNRVIINDVIDDEASLEICHLLQRICDENASLPKRNRIVTLLINSYGGNIYSGNAIIGMMDYMKSKGFEFIGIVQGMAFSMAFDILCNCDKRYGLSYSEYMVHQSQIGTRPQSLIRIERMVKYQKTQWEKSMKYYMRDTKLTKEQLEDIYENDKELWLLAEEALDLNIIQKILK